MKAAHERYAIDSSPLRGTRRVFLARRRSDATTVIVKTIDPVRSNPRHVAALQHEFSVLSRLEGAPVARPVELIEDDDVSLVLEPARGRALDEIISGAPLDVARCSALGLLAARALAAVHQRGVLHRDIKPHHLFVDEQHAEATLIDFGLATELNRQRRLTVEPDRLEGTLAYISPEQTGRMNRSVDRRSDLYSFGVMLYEMCTGKLPFETEDALELVHAHIARQPISPRTHRPDLPEALERIILCLLAKAAEDRYQTTWGLVADLERVHSELSSSGSVAPFALRGNDYDGELRIPEKLYGRQPQRQALLDAARRARQGGRELVVLAGPAGVGKSALVQEVHHEVVRDGHFVSGKFEQYHRGAPYSALGKACGELVRVLMASPPRELEAWKARLRVALGNNVRVVSDVVPELALALGEHPEAPPLPPTEAQNRFERSFRKFMQASARQGSPLVLFLDDLQWADSASIAVLELVLSSPEQSHLLAIGCYRDADVDTLHPLSRCLERLREHLPIQRIELAPLSVDDVEQLVSDALPLTTDPVEPLARVIAEKTSGNAFFIAQFLERLAEEGHLRFQEGRGFGWDLDAISRLCATDNVVDLVVKRLNALPLHTQRLLQLAACIGHRFRLRHLSAIADAAPREVASALDAAVAGGFLLPLDRNHRLLDELLAREGSATDAAYGFVHDRVQQAAYATMLASERTGTHLRIGRMLLSRLNEAEASDERLFEAVTQLNSGRDLVVDPAERTSLARLNLRAAERAMRASAHASALDLSSRCLDLLGAHPFETDHATSLAAHLVSVKAQYLARNDESVLQGIEIIEREARSVLDRVPARNLKTTLLIHQGRLGEACAASLATMALLGLSLPDPNDQAALDAAIGQAFADCQRALGQQDVAALSELPAMTHGEKLALIDTIAATIPAAHQWKLSLMALLVLHAVLTSLEHGTAPATPFFYALYGVVHNAVTKDYRRSHRFGELAIELARRPEHASYRGGVHFIYASFLAPWMRPLSEILPHYEQGMVDALDSGDHVHALYCASLGAVCRLDSGEPLSRVSAPIPRYIAMVEAYGDVLNRTGLLIVERTIACLESEAPRYLDGDGFSEEEFEQRLEQMPPSTSGVYGVRKGMVHYLCGDPEGALIATEAYAPLTGFAYGAEHTFYHGMACAELARDATGERRAELLAKLDVDVDCFAQWCECCPQNFAARFELLRAESLACRGRHEEALSAFEAALERALAAPALHHRALAFERSGIFHLRQGRHRLAQNDLAEACRQFERWGATAKVMQLRREHPTLRRFSGVEPEPGRTTAALTRTQTGSAAAALDMTSAMRATAAMASELRLGPLLRRLMEILVTNAGATRGALVLSRDDELRVRATLHVESAEVAVDLDEPLAANRTVASTIVQYCARTNEVVVVDDASRDQRFAQDPVVTENRAVGSIMCLPLSHQGKLAGVLYLQNEATTGAFHTSHVERLAYLGAHAAASLENARLYDALEVANASLEQRVRERTAELSRRNQDMRRVLDNVAQGLLTIDVQGRLASERSRMVDEWFGPIERGTEFIRYFERIDERFARYFELTFEQVLDGVLPEDAAIGQMPSRLEHGGRQFNVGYEPIHDDGHLIGLLIVMDDVTAALRRAREEAEQREELALCQRLSHDREGLLAFFEEAGNIVGQLSRRDATLASLLRGLHTLKGSAGMLAFTQLAERCHLAEDAIQAGAAPGEAVVGVIERFQALRQMLSSIAGDHAGERVEVSREVLNSLAARLHQGLPAKEAALELERLQLEPLSRPLRRMAEHARALAARLGKASLAIEVSDDGSFGDARATASLWAALLHLVRNAVDHGIERAPERVAAGKAECARLALSARREEAFTRIEIRDDGRGVDWGRVRTLAMSRGLPARTREDLARALFESSFSTRDEVSETSGRGIGLGAVRAEVEALGGRISIESEPGQGCCFVVQVPNQAFRPRPGVLAARA